MTKITYRRATNIVGAFALLACAGLVGSLAFTHAALASSGKGEHSRSSDAGQSGDHGKQGERADKSSVDGGKSQSATEAAHVERESGHDQGKTSDHAMDATGGHDSPDVNEPTSNDGPKRR
jgi:hypothetical protein